MNFLKSFFFALPMFAVLPAFAFQQEVPAQKQQPKSAKTEQPAGDTEAKTLIATLPEGKEIEEAPADTVKIEPYSSLYYQQFVTAAWQEKHGNKDEAFKIYESLNKVTPGQPAILKSICSIAIEKEDSAAMAKYVPLLMQNPAEDADTFNIYATWLWSKGDLQQALTYYKKAMQLDPDNPFIIFKYASLLSSMDADAAVKYLDGITLSFPKVAGTISLQIADYYLKSGKEEAAVNYLKQATKHNPQLVEPYLGRAKIYEYKGNMQAALEEYLTLDEIGYGDSEILTKIGAFYILSNDRATAKKYFIKAKELKKDNPLAAQFLSLQAEQDGDYAAAAQYLLESSEYPTSAAYYVKVSYFFTKAGNFEKAVSTLQQAHEKFPQNSDAAFYYALALMDYGDYDKALKIIKQLLKDNPDNTSALLQYAFILEKEKKYKDMEVALRRFLVLEPDNASALNFLGYYLVDKTKKTQEGGDYIKKALALEPTNPAVIDSMGWYYYKSGDLEKSLPLLTEASKNIEDEEVFFHLAVVYEGLGDFKNAVVYYAKVLDLNPKNKTARKGLKRSQKEQNKQ